MDKDKDKDQEDLREYVQIRNNKLIEWLRISMTLRSNLSEKTLGQKHKC